MEQYNFLLEEIKKLQDRLEELQDRLEELENEKKDNYCRNCESLSEKLMYKCENCERIICRFCCIVKDGDLVYCPRNCCNKP